MNEETLEQYTIDINAQYYSDDYDDNCYDAELEQENIDILFE